MAKRPLPEMGLVMPSVALTTNPAFQVLVLLPITLLQPSGLTLLLMASPIRERQCSVNFNLYPDLERQVC